MNGRIVLRTISTILICVGVLVYIAAKINFFRHYGQSDYLQQHSIYWLLIAGLAFLLLLVERLFPETPQK